MGPFILGSAVGIALAILNFWASIFYSSKILTRSQITSTLLALIGFIGRLTLIGVIFYLLTGVTWIHFKTSLITFVICFTLCLIWKATRVYRETKPLLKQPTEM
jgi:hypothetical protein